jgi:hypothetical protein
MRIRRRMLAAAALAALVLSLLAQAVPSEAKCDADAPTFACLDRVGGRGGQ